ncbi:MAG: deoxyguanosinetriphosphate triphosphohydrolase [Clostridia bacterium]|nr:deoxyguanosinetriphosphate triphosphohydrolase [Clostridia bacterium]
MKEITYKKEEMFLSPFATRSIDTKGRKVAEEECPLRTEFQRDRDRIAHSKAFRRLKNKTQVFLAPEGDHYRTRMTHTLDVSQIARSISRSLDLNEDLTEAIALGHDLGHTPFGHAGERTLQKLLGAFDHSKQSLRIVDVLEKDGEGLNLTWEVKDGIVNHQTEGNPHTLEGHVVRLADKIAYVNHDIDDAIRAGLITVEGLPSEYIKILGSTARERINTMITSIYNESKGQSFVRMSPEVHRATYGLRDFMFAEVYGREQARQEEERTDRMLTVMFEFYLKNPDRLPELYKKRLGNCTLEQSIADYISGMSDTYAVHVFQTLYMPSSYKLSL